MMVPPVERSDSMYEIRNMSDNIAKERCEHSEVQPPGQNGGECEDRVDVHQPVPESVGNLATTVGPAFHIPMTQDKTLEELPSQLDFDWQDSVSPKGTPAVPTAMAVAPKDPEESAFVEVSQIAHEAVVHATQQQAERETDPPTTTTNVSN